MSIEEYIDKLMDEPKIKLVERILLLEDSETKTSTEDLE